MKNALSKLFISAVALASMSNVFAADVATTFDATATVSAVCFISATPLAFGAFAPTQTSTMLEVTNSMTATCTKETPYSVSLNAGNSGDFSSRQMKSADAGNVDPLVYNIFVAPGGGTISGDGTGGTAKLNANGTGAAQVTNLYGILDKNQILRADTYTDTITVTLTY